MLRGTKNTREIKGIIFDLCKTNNDKIKPNKSNSAYEIFVSSFIKILKTLVYKHAPLASILPNSIFQPSLWLRLTEVPAVGWPGAGAESVGF